jgi:hypothetical protein
MSSAVLFGDPVNHPGHFFFSENSGCAYFIGSHGKMRRVGLCVAMCVQGESTMLPTGQSATPRDRVRFGKFDMQVMAASHTAYAVFSSIFGLFNELGPAAAGSGSTC